MNTHLFRQTIWRNIIDHRRHISSNPFNLKTIIWKMDKFEFYIFNGLDLKCILALSCPSCSNTIIIKKSLFDRLRFIGIPFFARSWSPFQVLARQADEGGGWPFKTHISPSTSALFRLFEPFEAAQGVDLGDGQFSERCHVDGSFFNSDTDTDYFWKSLTSPSSRLFSLTIRNDYFSIILLILGPIILGLFTIWFQVYLRFISCLLCLI